MNFSNSSIVEQLLWTMRLADYPRSLDRARINRLFNGSAPYTAAEVASNGIAINVNDLCSTRLAHDARNQLYNSFLKPGNFFSLNVDRGPIHKRQEWSSIVTKEINRLMKRSMKYSEKLQSTFASQVLHGIGPAIWQDRDSWCPDAKGIEDLMIPSNTLRSMDNLPFFGVFESYTFWQLYQMTHGPKVDPGWNMPEVESTLRWAYDDTVTLLGTTWPEVWSPEKMEERIKQDSGFFAADAVPTIDCWKFYFLDDSKGKQGWKMRIVLDAFGSPGVGGTTHSGYNFDGYTKYDGKTIRGDKSAGFLYSSGDRVYGDDLQQMASFQFADLSAVAPFRYHSVRSLGFLLYAPCHLQMRMRCKFSEAVFENLMMYFRVHNMDDAERALKIDLISRGYIDDSVEFVKPQDRWQVNAQLVELGMQDIRSIIDENSSSYVQNQNFSRDKVEKTKFQVMAEVNAMQTLISSALMLGYQNQSYEYNEIFRRFCKKNSKDKDVRLFRLNCLKQGVPEEYITPECWNLEPDRVMGAGNKTIELQAAQLLMQFRNLYDPPAQRRILEKFTLAATDDPGETRMLVPDKPQVVNPSAIKAQYAAGALMQGLKVDFERGIDLIPYCESLLLEMATVCAQIQQAGGVPESGTQIAGLQNLGAHIGQVIQIIGQDENEKQRAREYSKDLGNLMNETKAFGQRWQEKQQSQNGNGGMSPEAMQKVQAANLMAQTKAKNAEATTQQRLAHKQASFEQKARQNAAQHELNQRAKLLEVQTSTAAKDLETAAAIKRDRAKSFTE